MSREIITFQIGNYSNYVGTHWWNLQEATFVYQSKGDYKSEINHDVLFREGLTLKGDQTYTPRLISIDFPDALSRLKVEGSLYDFEQENEIGTWYHEVSLHKQEQKTPVNDFLRDLAELDNPETPCKKEKLEECPSREEMETDPGPSHGLDVQSNLNSDIFRKKIYHLDESVSYWSDYLRLHYHPRTSSTIKNFYLSDNSFNITNYGCTVYQASDGKFREELEDKIHFFSEETDNLQGFHMLADIYNGFGGLTSVVLADLVDQFPKKGVLTFCPFPSVRDCGDPSTSLYDLINTTITMMKLVDYGCCVVPLCLTENPFTSHHSKHTDIPNVVYKANLAYHTSAILAAAVDTSTLSHRVFRNSLPLSHLIDTMTAGGRKLSNLSFNLPFPLRRNISVIETYKSLKDPWISLSPLYNTVDAPAPLLQSAVLRGVKPTSGALLQEIYRTFPNTSSSLLEVNQECYTEAPFPHIFTPNVDENGLISEKPRSKNNAVSRIAVLTSLSSSVGSYAMLSHLFERSSKLGQRHLHKYLESGLEFDDWKEILSQLNDFTEVYKDNKISYDE